MDVTVPCQNCVVLRSQCLLLKEEVKNLNQKLDKLLDIVLREKNDSSTQTHCISYQSQFCQTELNSSDKNSVQSETISFSQSCELDTHISEALTIPTLNTSLASIHDDVLMDIFVKSSETNAQISTSPSYASSLIVLPYISLPNQPFSNFDYNKLDQDSNFDIRLNNRSLCYYGCSKYTYNGISHQPKPIPETSNSIVY